MVAREWRPLVLWALGRLLFSFRLFDKLPSGNSDIRWYKDTNPYTTTCFLYVWGIKQWTATYKCNRQTQNTMTRKLITQPNVPVDILCYKRLSNMPNPMRDGNLQDVRGLWRQTIKMQMSMGNGMHKVTGTWLVPHCLQLNALPFKLTRASAEEPATKSHGALVGEGHR